MRYKLLRVVLAAVLTLPLGLHLEAGSHHDHTTPVAPIPATRLVLLARGINPDQHPPLSQATLYHTPSRTLAVLPGADAREARTAGLLERVFPGNPAMDEWYLVRATTPAEQPPLSFVPVLLDGDVALYRVEPSQAAELGAFGAQLERLAPLPRLVPSGPTPAVAASSAIEEAVEMVSEESWSAYVRELSGDARFQLNGDWYRIESRHVEHPDNTLAGDYIAARLQSMGYDVSFQTFNYAGGIERNVVAILPGTTRPNDIYVIGGHFDCTNGFNPGAPAPGADDNASGVAMVLEAARVLAEYRFQSTIHLVLFNAEEVGLIGSQEYVRKAAEDGLNIKGVIIGDMVAYFKREYEAIIEGTIRYRRWMSQAAQSAETYSDLPTVSRFYSFGSDHVPFQSAGIPAYLLIEKEWRDNPGYHSQDDTFDLLEPHMGVQMTRTAVATIANAAGIQGE